MNPLKFTVSLIILTIILSCNRISEKVEKKINEKIDKTIEENLNKIDTSLSKSKLDSLKKLMNQFDTTWDNEEQSKSKKKNR